MAGPTIVPCAEAGGAQTNTHANKLMINAMAPRRLVADREVLRTRMNESPFSDERAAAAEWERSQSIKTTGNSTKLQRNIE
ncbi:hypothetical protein GCM10010178_81400 [Lentzea flava]|uniref:Uncharacterized protein n=1 Tax=Lentzea flava TaxID=103732 RepID=A0ABQ2VB62_9PSEU|nr:hypothetical protein GCM10010178_81400 [Lentzea flava]